MAITTVHNELIAVNAISGTAIADNAVTSVHIALNNVGTVQIALNSVTSVSIALNQVTGTQIANNAITSTQLADNAVTATKVPDGTQFALGATSFTGAITTNSTVDGIDIATRDAILTSTTTTAGAALPKAGGAMTGAITTNSTFDGIDIATRDAVLTSTTTTANAAAPLANPTLTGTPAAPTASGSTSTTQLATTAFVQQELTTLIGGAPSTLNDLNELAAAINDDANYNSTLTTALATKLPLAGGTMTGNIAHAGNFTLDVGGEIRLSADDNGEIHLYDGSLHYGSILEENSNLLIRSIVDNEDILFQGYDATVLTTALTLDMSKAGAATFNAGVTATGLNSSGGLNITGNGAFVNAANKFGVDQNVGAARFYSSGANASTNGSFEFHNTSSDGSGDTINLAINASGNVGIGNTSPSHPLTIGTGTIAAPHSGTPNMVLIGGLTAGLTISNTSNSGTGSIFFGDAANSTVGQIRYNHNTGDMAFTAEDDFTFAGNIIPSGYISQGTGQSHYFRGGTDANWRIGSDITADTGGIITGAALQMIVGGSGNTYGFQIFGHTTPTLPVFEVIPNTAVADSITNIRGRLFIGNNEAITADGVVAHVGTSAPSSPSAGKLWFDTTVGIAAMQVYNGSGWDRMSNKVSATGGTVSTYTSGGTVYRVHAFTSSGTFVTESSGYIDVLVVAGGGGGHGGFQSPGGGGGGAGGVIYSTALAVTSQSYTVTVGAGGVRGQGDGTAVNARPTSGGNSVFSTLTAIGGGFGGGYNGYASGSGGSAGGSGYSSNLGSPTSGQGNAGGDSAASTSQNAGGGGGKGAAGGYGNDTTGTTAGVGGVGQAYSISGSSVYYAGGGGGGSGYQGGSGGTNGGVGGNGGGGAGGASNSSGNCSATNGTANTGGGGGGAGGPVGSIDQTQQLGGHGGTGIVIIRYAV